MINYCLKFANKAEAYIKLIAFTTLDENGDRWFVNSHPDWALDEIGVLYNEPAKNELGEPTETPTAKAGYHINLMVNELPESLQAYVINPTTPSREWL